MDWWRHYNYELDDPIIQQLPDRLFKAYTNLRCLASAQEVRGTLPDVAAIAFRLRMSERQAEQTLRELERRGLLALDRAGGYYPARWDQEQYESDSSTGRVQKHRAKQRNDETLQRDDETFQQRFGNVAETAPEGERDSDSDSDTESEDLGGESVLYPARAGALALAPTREVTPVPKVQARSPAETIRAQLLTPAMRAFAQEHAPEVLDLAAVVDDFLDYLAEHGQTRSDYLAAFRRWLRREPRFQKNGGSNGANNAAARRSGKWDAHVSALSQGRGDSAGTVRDSRAVLEGTAGPDVGRVVPYRGRVGERPG